MREHDGLLPQRLYQLLASSILDGLELLDKCHVDHLLLSGNFIVLDCSDASAPVACISGVDHGAVPRTPSGMLLSTIAEIYRPRKYYLPHCSPELLSLFKASQITGVCFDWNSHYVSTLGQSTFQAGMLFGYMLLKRCPLLGYPTKYQHRSETGTITYRYTREDICVLSDAESTALRAAGYCDEILKVIRAMLDPDPHNRPFIAYVRELIMTALGCSEEAKSMVCFLYCLSCR